MKQGSIKDPNLDDTSDYRRMEESMNKVGFSEEEKANIFKVIAAVLHVGNIAFEDSGDTEGTLYAVASSELVEKINKIVSQNGLQWLERYKKINLNVQ